MKSMSWRRVALAAFLGAAAVCAPAQEAFYEPGFSLYGYLVNFFNANLYGEDWTASGSDYGNLLYGRLKGDWNPGNALSFHAELAYQGSVGNQNLYSVFHGYGKLPVDLADPQAVFNEDLTQQVWVDHLRGSVNLGGFDLQFGKLPLAWGTGYFFNPTARAATAAYLDTITEETPGTLAVAPSLSFLDGRLALQGYLAFQDRGHSPSPLVADGDWANLPFGLKVQGIAGSFDLSASWIKEYQVGTSGVLRTHYLGADFAGAVWDFGVYGEAALKVWDEASGTPAWEAQGLADLLEACIGFDYFVPGLELDTRLEYYHQGSGVSDPDDYDVDRLLSGEQSVLARDYLLLYAERGFLDYFRFSAVGLVNLNDGSLAVLPELSGEPYANFQVALGAMLFLGREGSEFDGRYALFAPYDLTCPAVYLRCKLSF